MARERERGQKKKNKNKGRRMLGDSREEHLGAGERDALEYPFLKRLAAQGVARHIAEFVGKVTI